MWRSASIVILLLAGSLAGSPALAGQASAVIRVGITITGSAAQVRAKDRASSSSVHAVPGSPGGASSAAPRRSARPRQPQ
jgi:hypothetical protein